MDKYIKNLLVNAKIDSASIANAPSSSKNEFLSYLEKQLISNKDEIISENKKDLTLAKKNKLEPAFIDRLIISSKTIDSMCEGLRNIHSLNDPIGNIEKISVRPNGLKIGKMRVPLGVILIIYESRPNVTIDVAALAVKSGNSVILRGGSEALHSNLFLGKLIQKALQLAKLPSNAVQIVNKAERSLVTELITAKDYIDVIIPRGGKGLIKNISDNAKIPVIKHLDGNCHIYVDEFASLNQALEIVENSKTQRYGTCNTLESLVVHKSIADQFLKKIASKFKKHKVEIRGCNETCKILTNITKATADDFYEEYLAPIISIKIVNSLKAGIDFINKHSSKHTEAIITENYTHAQTFLKLIDSSSVMINASTRFADGFEYGLGAEVGISTDKFHARGPVGLEGLTSEKYVVFGEGQTRT
ncbi:MAG: glutamate-5-semialdehyde dehydrogenase [Betaproteobacteria bacterium]|nr:glutamate-5-semialdehyde dehydrogenase [Betaproteobacteria bacterium]